MPRTTYEIRNDPNYVAVERDIGAGHKKTFYIPRTQYEAQQKALTPSQSVETNIARDNSLFDTALGTIRDIRGNVNTRLGDLRSDRNMLLEARKRPLLNQMYQQTGAMQRGIRNEGSLQSMGRSEAGLNQELGRQQIESQTLQEQLGSEAGLQQLENQYTTIFNQMASEGFSRELSGLGEEVDKYFAKVSGQLGAQELAMKARGATMDMLGRFAQASAEGYDAYKRANQPSYSYTAPSYTPTSSPGNVPSLNQYGYSWKYP